MFEILVQDPVPVPARTSNVLVPAQMGTIPARWNQTEPSSTEEEAAPAARGRSWQRVTPSGKRWTHNAFPSSPPPSFFSGGRSMLLLLLPS